MNIAEILRDCPEGTKLYSLVCGELELVCVTDEEEYPIICRLTADGRYDSFTSDGREFFDYPDAKCVLFPSKDQRDWNKFIVPDQVPDQINDQETKHQFKPFDKVLVRDSNSERWRCDFFEQQEEKEGFNVRCFRGVWCQCIPYEGNEHLLGTTKKPEE